MESKGLDFAAVPINKLLGLELRTSSREGATVALPARESVTQEYDVVHGGILATLADTAAVYALHPFLEEGERMTSVAQVDVRQADQLVLTGLFTYMILGEERG